MFMWQTAIRNFTVAERVAAMENEGLAEAAAGLRSGSLRDIARHQASEVNRLFFAGWGWAQLPVGLAAIWLALRGRAGTAAVAAVGAMLLISAFLALNAVPETVRLGRLMDFAADGSQSAVESAFWRLHHAYTGLDMLKFALGLAATALVWRRSGRGA